MADGVSDAGAGAPRYDWQDPSYRSFELGDVFGRAMRALGKHFVPLSLIAIPLVFLPNLLVSVLPYIGLGESADLGEVLSAQFSLSALIATGIVLIVGAVIAPAAMVSCSSGRSTAIPYRPWSRCALACRASGC